MTSLHEADWIRLGNDRLQLAIDPQGAQLSMLRDARGVDLLWDGDPAWWSGRAPILFPIVGALHDGRYRWQGREYTLPRHGFARGRRFDVLQAGPDAALLRLEADEATRAVYPFEFQLDIAFRLQGSTLTITATARNTGEGPMPASLGFHPAFRWPLPGGTLRPLHAIHFAVDEPAPVRRLDAHGLLQATAEPSPVKGRMLPLDDALFARDVLIFDDLKSRGLRFVDAEDRGIEVGFPDARYLGVWTRPGAPFLCIEPWRGVADPQGFDEDFSVKPGIEVLEHPGDSFDVTMVMRVSS